MTFHSWLRHLQSSLSARVPHTLATHVLGLLQEMKAGDVSGHLRQCATCRVFLEFPLESPLLALSTAPPGPSPRREGNTVDLRRPSTDEAAPGRVWRVPE